MMKKAALKLVIRREMLRLLTGMELRFIGGGAGTGDAGTGCPNVRLVDTGGPNRTCVA
jgi:hypothetical protein